MSSSLCSEATTTSAAEMLMLSESSAPPSVAAEAAAAAATVAAAAPEDLAFSLDNLALLVEDIKDGFAATMQQLVSIQGQDTALRSRLDTAELETRHKMDELQAAVLHMREQFASVVARVESLELHHRQLEGQVDQLDRAAQAERVKMEAAAAAAASSPAASGGDVQVCCNHPIYGARAICQTPMTPYSCATPLSPDSGRPGTCTPSCFHSNEFQCSEQGLRSDAAVGVSVSAKQTPHLYRCGSATTVATAVTAAVASASAAAPGSSCQQARAASGRLTHHLAGSDVAVVAGSCEIIAEKSLHMSRALVDRFAHVDSSGEDCELDSLAAEPSVDQSSSECLTNGCDSQHAAQLHQLQPADSEAAVACLAQPAAIQRQVAPHERVLQQDRRRRVCQEIVETERKYCSCLWTIIDLIAESLKSATFLSMKDLCLIFPKCLPRLYELHSTFLGLLEERLRAEESPADGEAAAPVTNAAGGTFSTVVLDFLEANNGELFDLYRDYANDFGTAVQTIRKYQQHSARFRKLQHSLQHHPSCEGLDLTAFLLTPVQRMPRYLLLMRQLSVHTQAGHRDEVSLNCVLERLHCLLDELNYSIQTALRQAAEQQQQQQQRWKRSRSLPRPADAAAAASSASSASTSASAASLATAEADALLSGSSGRSSVNGRHFLANGTGASSAAALLASRQTAAPVSSRCRSMPPPPQHQQQLQQLQQPQQRATPTRMESPNMGPRSRLISRQLRTADRCLSTGDILRASPAPSVASAGSAAASPVIVREERVQQRQARRGTPPKSTLKESFRRMFQSKRKSSLAKLDSPPSNSCSTFEDENGDPCTDV